MRISVASYGGLLVAALALGCGKSGKSADEVCTLRAKVTCDKRSTCSQGYAITRDFGTMQNCLTQEKQVCMESVERKGSGNTAERVEACTAAIEKQSCDDRAAGVPLAACESGGGDFKDGTPCISTNQCASSYCDIPPGQACGKCAKKVADGMPCDSSGDCMEGSYCQRPPMAVMGICARSGEEGATCNDTLRCGTGLSCIGFSASRGVDGTCRRPAAAASQPCDNIEKLCVSGLRCVGLMTSGGMVVTEGTCRALKRMEGEICDSRNRNDVDCDSGIGLYCHHEQETNPATGNPQPSATGVCKKRLFAKTGEMCGTLADGTVAVCSGGDACQRTLDPITQRPDTTQPGTCVRDNGDGMPCNTDGNIGPGCLPGHACVLDMPGLSTAGKCRKRTYEVLCNVK